MQALFSGAGQGRNREQETWQQHRARVTATALPIADDPDNEHGHGRGHGDSRPDVEERRAGTPAAVTVTGTALGTGGLTAARQPYRLDCLTVQDPAGGWHDDDVAVLPPAPDAG